MDETVKLIGEVKNYIFRPGKTDFFQIVWSFIFGMVGGPLSKGIGYLLLGIIFNEIIIAYTTYNTKWRFEIRVVLFCATFLGWNLGRWLFHDECGIEGWSGLPQKVFKGECSIWKR